MFSINIFYPTRPNWSIFHNFVFSLIRYGERGRRGYSRYVTAGYEYNYHVLRKLITNFLYEFKNDLMLLQFPV